MERGAALRGGADGRSGGEPDARTEAVDTRRRSVHVGGIRERRKHRFAGVAADGGDRGTAVVTAGRYGYGINVRPHGGCEPEAGMAGPDASNVLPQDAAEDRGTSRSEERRVGKGGGLRGAEA